MGKKHASQYANFGSLLKIYLINYIKYAYIVQSSIKIQSILLEHISHCTIVTAEIRFHFT